MYLYFELVLNSKRVDGVLFMEKDKHLGLRIDSDTHKKLKNLAEYDGRSINGEVLYLIRQAISEHEKNHGSLDDN